MSSPATSAEMISPSPMTPPARPGPMRSHRTDLVAFVFGLGFLAIGLISLGNQLDWFGSDDGQFGGITLAVIGAIGVLAVLAAGLRRSRAEHRAPGIDADVDAVTTADEGQPSAVSPGSASDSASGSATTSASTPEEATDS